MTKVEIFLYLPAIGSQKKDIKLYYPTKFDTSILPKINLFSFDAEIQR